MRARGAWVWAIPLATACALLGARAHGEEVLDGTTVFGVYGGLARPSGTATSVMGDAAVLGAEVVHHWIGEWGMGLDISHRRHSAVAGRRAQMTTAFLLSRGNINLPIPALERYIPYALMGLGYAEGRARLDDGSTDSGAGYGICLGIGIDRVLTSRLSLAAEGRWQRLAVPLKQVGLPATTTMSLGLNLRLWIEPDFELFRSPSQAL